MEAISDAEDLHTLAIPTAWLRARLGLTSTTINIIIAHSVSASQAVSVVSKLLLRHPKAAMYLLRQA